MIRTTSLIVAVIVAAAGCARDDKPSAGKPLPPAGATSGEPAPTASAPGAVDPSQPLPPGHPPMGGGAPHGGAMGGGAPHGGAMGGMGGEGGKTLADAGGGRKKMGSFTLVPPAGWQEKPTRSGMRAAEWRLPGEGGAEDAELVAYYFGQGGAGGVEANLERWIGQFQQPDGKPSKERATIANTTVAGQKATMVDVEGRYVAAMMPGAPEAHDKPDWRMLAAIVESPDGPYYFKLVGPKTTVARHKAAFDAMVADLKL
jgi:hypothetical protein